MNANGQLGLAGRGVADLGDKRVMYRIVAFSLSVGLLLGVGLGAAKATTVYSPWSGTIGPYLGKTYKNQADLNDTSTPGRLTAGTTNQSQSGAVPTGYMGRQGRLFKGSALCGQGTMGYNSSSATSTRGAIVPVMCGNGTYKSWGVTAHYTAGNPNYAYFYTLQSPNIVYP